MGKPTVRYESLLSRSEWLIIVQLCGIFNEPSADASPLWYRSLLGL